jgi:nucleoside-diphosphate-sugar epimerase
MKVFVAGTTGVLGRRVVAELLAMGSEVTGVARTRQQRDELAALGVRPVELELFDPDAVREAVAGHHVVCNVATAIPVGESASRLSAWQENDRIRREASRNLVDAALAAGATRYVQESIAFLYADGGDRFLEESAAVDAAGITSAAPVAEAEAARFAEHGGVGVALRFGQFYGFDSGHTVSAIDAARSGLPVEFGPEQAFRSAITTDDAASAVVAALRAPSGVYNVVDDRPLTRGDYVEALAHALGVATPAVRSVPELPSAFSAMLRSQRVSNQRFKAVTGWRPRCADAWDGWASVVAQWRTRNVLQGG